MSDGTTRKSIDRMPIPIKFDKVYELAYKKHIKGERQNGNKDKSINISKK